MKSKELPEDLRDRIVSRHRSGEGYKKIAEALKVSRSTVRYTIAKWNKFGTTKTLPRSGRPVEPSSRRAKRALATKNPAGQLDWLSPYVETESNVVSYGEVEGPAPSQSEDLHSSTSTLNTSDSDPSSPGSHVSQTLTLTNRRCAIRDVRRAEREGAEINDLADSQGRGVTAFMRTLSPAKQLDFMAALVQLMKDMSS